MKTFNFMKLVAVLAMGLSLSAFGFFGCCKTEKCAPKKECAPCAGKACTLKPDQVEIVKTCDHPGYYRQVCRLEYEPCQGQVTRHKACPIFKGCFEEGTNKRLDGSGLPTGEGVAYTQEVQIQHNRVNGKRAHRVNGNNAAMTQPISTPIE